VKVSTLLPPRLLLVVALVAALGALVAISPPVEAAAEDRALAHYTQHGGIFVAGMLMGLALRDLVAARPWGPWTAVGVGAVALLADIGLVLPLLDEAVETNETLHFTQHGLVFLAGALMGAALRDLVLRGHGPLRLSR
jgi:peptidoglycan/LPS O-acetylase OafA/YrhL